MAHHLIPSNATSDVRKKTLSDLAISRIAAQRVTAGLPPIDSFEAIAREWHTKNVPTWAPSHSSKIIRRLEQDVFPWIGAKPINTIRPTELLSLLRRVEERGAIERPTAFSKTVARSFATPSPLAAQRVTRAATFAAPSPHGNLNTTRR